MSRRRVGSALAAIGAAATVGIGALLLATPSAVQAEIAAGSTIKVVVPTNGQCELKNVATHTLPSDEIVYEAPNYIITRVPDKTIATDSAVRFAMTVDTRASGCAMQQPVTATVNGRPVRSFDEDISRRGSTMTGTFHPPGSKPTATETKKPKPTKTATMKPTETPTAKPTETPTAKPTETPTQKPTESPTPTAAETTPPALPTTGGRLGPLVGVGLTVLVVGGLLAAAASARRLRRSDARS